MWNPKAKRIPYGIQGFEMLRRDNCYYVDKTRFIQEIEYANKYFFWVRPRRFGKTLTMTMLEAYYDINKKDKFEEIFSGLWIGENPSPSRQLGRYMDETHRTGYLRTFFNAVKDGSKTAIERLFITGVSLVTLDDLTSGFNIGTNYTTDARFNEITGFTEQEAREMLTYYSGYFKFPCSVDEIIETIRPWYDNYCFAEDCFGESSVFKPSEVLYFLCRFCNDNEFPDSMPDSMNIYSDFLTPKMLIRKDKDFKYEAAIVKQLLFVGHYNFVLKDDFPPENIADKDVFISLLFYYGLITICGQENGLTVFKITNREAEEQLRDFVDVQRF